VALLEPLLSHIKDTSAPLAVRISDSKTSVTYLLGTFLSKNYEVKDKCVKFGYKNIILSEMKVNISFDITVEDDT